MRKSLIIISILITGCTSTTQTTTSNANLVFRNAVYEDEIRTVRVYPNINDPYQEIYPAVAELGKHRLVLEFDDLVEGKEDYYARLIHCEADWTKSRLSPLQYMNDFNEFSINKFEFSNGTKIPYVHYTFDIPTPKIAGNYILEVYRDTEDNVVFRHRIMFYQPLINITSDDLSAAFNTGRLNQRINFLIEYSQYDLTDPLQRVTVVIRQNQRWDNVIFNIRPTFVRPDQHELEYQYFDMANNFSGGNEFRSFDIRSVNSAGANIQQLVNKDTTTAILMVDYPRDYQAYALERDLNGMYVISNYDLGNDDHGSEYVNVIFTLKTGRKFLGDIYIHGALSEWQFNQLNKMRYLDNLKSYRGSLLLKQGWYDYQYLIKEDSIKSNYLEGDHWETENSYDILVYYTPIDLNTDILIGYSRWMVNPRY